MTAFC
ncbi:hypothetical protein YPPY19_1286, partial [Yersinia pestis PY-19]